MCRRYLLELDDSQLGHVIKEKILSSAFLGIKKHEVYPEDQALVLILKNNQLLLTSKKWGVKSKSLIINARCETITERFTFKPMLQNRCIVIAKGFYEWKDMKTRQQKVLIQKKDSSLMFFAGIYNEKDEMVIITQKSEHEMKKVHHRVPVIFSKDEIIKYLKFEASYTNPQPEFKYQLCEES